MDEKNLSQDIIFLKEKYRDIVSEGIFKIILKKTALDVKEHHNSDFLHNLEFNVKKYIESSLNDDNKIIKILDNYINNYFITYLNLKNVLNNLINLINFINKYDIYIDDFIIEELVISNVILQSSLNFIALNINEKNKRILYDELMIKFLEKYMNIFNIKNSVLNLKIKDASNNYNDAKQRELIKKVQENDKKAKEELIICNDKLVYYIVNKNLYKIKNGKISKEDLLQEGRMAILKAAEKFDLTKKTRFSTYAVYWIKQYVNRSILEQGRTIRIAVSKLNLLNELNYAEEKFITQNGVNPTAYELAKEMNIPISKVMDILKYKNDVLSLDNYLNEESSTDGNYFDIIEDRNQDFLEFINLKLNIESFKEELENSDISFRDKRIIETFYGLTDGYKRTLEETGKIFNLTKEGVRQIIKRNLKRLGYDKRLNKVRKIKF